MSRLSPGAQLLRSSRLFSLPAPLPRPETQSAGQTSRLTFRNSDTATTIYPTRQAIATTESSLSRGDWGLKRPLPLRTARASRPALRITAFDTVEHVTDYESATDHARTLEKFQELGVAMGRRFRRRDNWRSAFEDSPNINAATSTSGQTDAVARKTRESDSTPWKYKGPLLQSMSEGEFEWYLEKRIKPRAAQFATFLGEHLRVKRLREMASNAKNKETGEWEYQYYTWLSGMDSEQFRLYKNGFAPASQGFVAYVHSLIQGEAQFGAPPGTEDQQFVPAHNTERSNDRPVQSRTDVGVDDSDGEPLENKQSEILDAEASRITDALAEASRIEQIGLAGLANWETTWPQYVQDSIRLLRHDTRVMSELNSVVGEFLDMPQTSGALEPREGFSQLLPSTSAEKATGEFTTHPSAGISYLHSDATLENHPLLGPRAHRTPQQARVLVARSQGANNSRTTLGVAGFAVGEPSYIHQTEKIDINTYGGQKVWVEIQGAYVDGRGMIQLRLRKADQQDVSIRENDIFPKLTPAQPNTIPLPRIEPFSPQELSFRQPLDQPPSGPSKPRSATLAMLEDVFNKQQALSSTKAAGPKRSSAGS